MEGYAKADNSDFGHTPLETDRRDDDVQQLRLKLQRVEETLLSSEQKKTSIIQKLKKSRREFLTIFDSVPAMIWYRDRQGKILRVNQCAADSVGKSVRDLVGKNYYELFPDGEERARQQDLEVIQTGLPLRCQLRSFTVDGHQRWAQVDRIPLRDQDQTIMGVMVFALDITDKKIAEDRLIRAKKEIEITNEQLQAAADRANQLADRATRSNQAKSEMLATSSHDLRTPMNAIIGFADLLGDTNLDEEQAEYVKTINNSAKGLLALLNDILDYAKLEAGKLNIEIVACLLKEFIGEIKAMMETSVRQKGLDFVVQVDKRLPHTFYCDPLRLKQCLINLVGNAIKFTESGRVGLYVTMEEHVGQKCLRIDVEDTGIGIAQEKLETIFHSYSQAEVSTARQYGGTGLGLSITKRLTELLGGQIRVSSTKGEGSVFTMILPLMTHTSEQADTLPIMQEQRDDQNYIGQGMILLAESSVPSQLTMSLMLRRAGMEVKVASSEQQIIDKISRYTFDLILIDAELDNRKGLDIVRRLRANEIQTPIIGIITSQDAEFIGEARLAGCNEYLIKPISRTQLHEVIRVQLQESHYEKRRNELKQPTTESVCPDEAGPASSMDVVEGIINEKELLGLLPELVEELKKVVDTADIEQADMILETLSRVSDSCNQPEIREKINQLRASLIENPDSSSLTGSLIEELNQICRDIDGCCNRE